MLLICNVKLAFEIEFPHFQVIGKMYSVLTIILMTVSYTLHVLTDHYFHFKDKELQYTEIKSKSLISHAAEPRLAIQEI